MTESETINKIHAMIRLQQDGYQKVVCPCCKEKPYVEKESGFLLVRCRCGKLNMSERGI